MFQMIQHLLGVCRILYYTCLLSLKQFGPVPLIWEGNFSLGGCDGPARRENFLLGGCAGPKMLIVRWLTKEY